MSTRVSKLLLLNKRGGFYAACGHPCQWGIFYFLHWKERESKIRDWTARRIYGRNQSRDQQICKGQIVRQEFSPLFFLRTFPCVMDSSHGFEASFFISWSTACTTKNVDVFIFRIRDEAIYPAFFLLQSWLLALLFSSLFNSISIGLFFLPRCWKA